MVHLTMKTPRCGVLNAFHLALLWLVLLATARVTTAELVKQAVASRSLVLNETALLAALQGAGPVVIASNILLTGSLPPIVNKTITIQGDVVACRRLHGHRCIVSGAELYRQVTVGQGGNLTLKDLHFTRGYSKTNGGAVLVESGGVATIRNMFFRFNFAQGPLYAGGAIEVTTGGSVDVANSVFIRNVGGFGGAIDVAGGAFARVQSSLFHNNSAAVAGGALSFMVGASGVVEANEFTANSAEVRKPRRLSRVACLMSSVSSHLASGRAGGMGRAGRTVSLCSIQLFRNSAAVNGNNIMSNGNSSVSLCQVPAALVYRFRGGTVKTNCSLCSTTATQ
eukprot:jgi/Mesen1/1785/ME000014S01184